MHGEIPQSDRQLDDSKGEATRYLIRVEGHLGPHWLDWFEGVSISAESDGNSTLLAEFVDQAALYAMLRRIRDAGMILLSITRVTTDQSKGRVTE